MVLQNGFNLYWECLLNFEILDGYCLVIFVDYFKKINE